jgi:nicotinamidase-related amidase
MDLTAMELTTRRTTTMLITGKPALVISEFQRGVVEPGRSRLAGLAEQVESRGVAARIGVLAEAFRAAGLPVVHCTIGHRPDLVGVLPNSLFGSMIRKHRTMISGTADVEVPEPVTPREGDIVSDRAISLTAFYGTDLDALLRLQHVETLVVTGVSTNLAIPGLSVEAVNRGYYVVLPEDATAGASAETHRFMVDNLLHLLARVTTTDEVLTELKAVPTGERLT